MKNKKRILFIGYDYAENGVGIFLKELSNKIKNDYEITFLVNNCKPSKNIYKIDSDNKKIDHLIENADLIHICAHNREHLKIAYKSFKKNKKIISSYHNFFYDKSSYKKRIELFIKKLIILNFCSYMSDYEIFLTEKQKENFGKFYLIKNKNKIVISNFIYKNKILKNKSNLKFNQIIFIGRPTKQKGFQDLIHLSKLVDINFLIVGDYKKYKIKNINSIGRIESNDLKKYYDNSQVLILPSYLEVFPMTILEAMARGLVILVSDIPGMREIVKEGRNGYLFPPGDVEKMKEIILYLKNNPKEIERISKNNLEDIWKFIAEKQIPKYIKVFEEMVNKNEF